MVGRQEVIQTVEKIRSSITGVKDGKWNTSDVKMFMKDVGRSK